MVTYLLRNVPARLWSRAKTRAKAESISLRELILRALMAYLGQ